MKPLLEIAGTALAESLHNCGRTKTFFEGEEIFAEGDKAEFLPIVVSGKIKMVRFPEIGKEVIIGIFQNGEMFAVPPAFDGGNFPSTAIAMEETKLLIIYRPDFLKLLRDSSEFSFAVIEWMSAMLREKTATIQNLVTASPEHRVGNVLLRLAKKEDEKQPVKITMRRQDIAEMAGLTTETTIRAVKKLADKDLLKIVHGKIILEQPERLRAFLR
ncbi:MAG: Crp/Fnr family transcriptional regulator [Pyrinomonadaceae bacterium]|nr:Crp/Fnr family transcriptional regulator [Pyrinomonadaceae bacterium]